jgi:hypothetical protein
MAQAAKAKKTPVALPTKLVNETEVAKQLCVSVSLLRKWRMKRVGLPFVKIGGRVVYRTEDVEQFINTRLVIPLKA